MYDVIALGECLIDFTPAGKNDLGMPLYSQNPGGAPANVLAMNARLGGSTAFLGKVGEDGFGSFLLSCLQQAGIRCEGLLRDPAVPTTLAFVQLDEKGDRCFSFYRNPGADLMLRAEELDRELLSSCRIFHYGTVSLTAEPCRSAVYAAIRIARESGALISCDPNYRPLLWREEKAAVREMIRAVSLADILKVSREEMELLTGEKDLRAGARALSALGPRAVFVTLGEEGAFFHTPAGDGLVPTWQVEAVDTTGAGDAFWGALLSRIPGRGPEALEGFRREDWEEITRFANGAGTLTTLHKGAIPAMPDREALEALVSRPL